MSVPSVRVSGLCKLYALGERRRGRVLRRAFSEWVRRGAGSRSEGSFWALRDVSFEVAPGEVLGVIGANGSGKSTLLKILAGITEPSRGEAEIRGRIGSLLEVGTGFHPELTGRENVFLNGTILGLSYREIQARFDAIVAFAEIEPFLDTPVKRYASGMYVRLAFAVAAHLDTDVMLVDEVLAVGDARFRQKCLARMREISSDGRTVIFVSHDMTAVEALCTRTLLLVGGRIATLGDTTETISGYLGAGAGGAARVDLRGHAGRTGARTLLTSVELAPEGGPSPRGLRAGEELRVRVGLELPAPADQPVLALRLRSELGQLVALAGSFASPLPGLPAGRSVVEGALPALELTPGVYTLDLELADERLGRLDAVEGATRLAVDEAPGWPTAWRPGSGERGWVMRSSWRVAGDAGR